MAITFPGAVTICSDGLQANASGEAVLDVSSLSLQQGDVLYIGLNDAYFSDRNLSASGNNSGACTEIADIYSNDTRDVNLGVFRAVQGATPDTSITVSGLPASAYYAARVVQVRGADTTTPEDVTATTATGIDGDDADPPSITPTTSGAKILAFYAAVQSGGNIAWKAPSNMSNFAQATNNHATTGGEPMIGSGTADWTSGAFNPDAATGGQTSTGNSWAAVTIAIRPSASSSQGLTPSLFTNSQTFHAPTANATYALTPSLFTNSASFHAPTVTPGAVTLSPSLLTNSQTFYAPTVGGAAQTLTASLFENAQTFYSATITVGAVTLEPSLFTNAQAFYAATITGGGDVIAPGLLINGQTFYSPTVSAGAVTLFPATLLNRQRFHIPQVEYRGPFRFYEDPFKYRSTRVARR